MNEPPNKYPMTASNIDKNRISILYDNIIERYDRYIIKFIGGGVTQAERVKNNKNNMFVFGSAGSGKDTISNYLRDFHNFVKIRNAGTIKQCICDTQMLNLDELEILKRDNPEFRNEHYYWSEILNDKTPENDIYAISRLLNLITNRSPEFDMLPLRFWNSNKKIISDVRMFEEVLLLLYCGYSGIFLTRQNREEYGNEKMKNHPTEFNVFTNKIEGSDMTYFEYFNNMFPNQIVLIHNDGYDSELNLNYTAINYKNLKELKVFSENYVNITAINLLDYIDTLMTQILIFNL